MVLSFPDTRLTSRRLGESNFSNRSKTLCIGCHRYCFLFEKPTRPSAFYLVVHQPCTAETDTCLQPGNPFLFYTIGTRADANLHKAFAYRYLSDKICTVVGEWTDGYFCLGYFSSSTQLRPRDAVGSEGVAAVCPGFCARSWVSWRKLQGSPSEHWAFFFPLVTETFSSFNADLSLSTLYHCSCFNSPVPGVEIS